MSNNNTEYTALKFRLSMCADSLNLAYWTCEEFHVEKAREDLLIALAGGRDSPRANLEDLIAQAIDDTIDVGWTSEQAAKRIVEVLLDDVIPPISEAAE